MRRVYGHVLDLVRKTPREKRERSVFITGRGLETAATTLIWAIIASILTWTAVGAFRAELFALGLLALTAVLILFRMIDPSVGHNYEHPHRYAMDDIRIPMPTLVEQGIVYVLPSERCGFGAAYGRRLDSEQTVLEEKVEFLEPLRIIREHWTLEKCRAAAQQLVEQQIKKIEGDGIMIKHLARWLYWHGRNLGEVEDAYMKFMYDEDGEARFDEWKQRWWEKMTPLPTRGCERRSDCKSLVGRDVALSLLLWECLVFESWSEIHDEDTTKLHRRCESITGLLAPGDVWRLRLEKYTGSIFPNNSGAYANEDGQRASSSGKGYRTAGSPPGIEGFDEAVGELYRILSDDPPPKGCHGRVLLGEACTASSSSSSSPLSTDPSRMKSKNTEKGADDNGRVTITKVPDESDYGGSETGFGSKSMNPVVRRGVEETRGVLRNLSPGLLPENGRSIIDDGARTSIGSLGKGSLLDTAGGQRDAKGLSEGERYAGKLWTHCWEAYPSTFGALYLWTVVWYIDVGNRGFHTTPLIPSGSGWRGCCAYKMCDYVTAWRIGWRDLWHLGVHCQMVAILPVILGDVLNLFA